MKNSVCKSNTLFLLTGYRNGDRGGDMFFPDPCIFRTAQEVETIIHYYNTIDPHTSFGYRRVTIGKADIPFLRREANKALKERENHKK